MSISVVRRMLLRYSRLVCAAWVLYGGALWPTNTLLAASHGRPNIVIMLVDDMGMMDTSVPFLTDPAGTPVRYPLNDRYRTPNMARLAERGICFNNFYAMSVCSPTRVSLMTGQNAARHRTTNWINPTTNNSGPHGDPEWNWRGLQNSDITLAKLLKQNGYRTIHIGKGHFGPENTQGANPLNLGFDVNIAGAAIGSPGSYYGQENFGHGSQRSHNAVPHLQDYHGTKIHLSQALTLEAKRQISEAAASGLPFFLYFPHYAVHSPFQIDERFAENYKELNLSSQALAFATMIEGVDQSLGEVMDHLSLVGVAQDTLLIFLGDNGSDSPLGHEHAVACASPLRGKKGSHYEGGMRTAFIAAWAQPSLQNDNQRLLPIAQGAIQSQVASVCDLFPTVLEMLHIPLPQGQTVDGRSLAIRLSGTRDTELAEQFLMHYPHGPHRSSYFTVLRDNGWKLIYHYFPSTVSNGSHYELYNLHDDPFEQHNLIAEMPTVLREMCLKMAARLETSGAGYPKGCHGIVHP